MSGELGLEGWIGPGQPRENTKSRGALSWNDSQVHRGQARLLGNPAVWGHIHTGAELRPEKINSHFRSVFVCVFGGGDGAFLVGGVTVSEQ